MGFEEKRHFYRIQSDTPISYRECGVGALSEEEKGQTTNISQAGIAFKASVPPQVSSLIWISLNLKEISICHEIESRAMITEDGILGRVVHIEDSHDEMYRVGVSFVTKDEEAPKT